MAPRRRQPVDPTAATADLRPTASPVDTFFRPNTSGRKGEELLVDLAPLSRMVQGYLMEKEKKEAREQALAGAKWATENPQLVAQLEGEAAKIKDQKARSEKLKSEFARLQREGQIPASADPYFQIGYAKSAARIMVGHYRDRLVARMNDVSATTDPQTGLPAAPADPEQIMADEWATVADSPALQNFYGGQVGVGMKAQIDEEFRAKAAERRGQKIETDYRNNTAQAIGQEFDRILAGNTVVDSATLQSITDMVATEARDHNLQEPRELVLQALKVSFARAFEDDPQEAIRAIHAAEDLVIENTRLGDDRSGVGEELAMLKRRYRDMASESATSDVRRKAAERQAAIQKGEDLYVGALLKAKREGKSIPLAVAEFEAQFLKSDEVADTFGGNAEFVIDEMHTYARNLDQARESDQSVVQRLNILIADGELDSAEALVRAAMKSGQLTGEAYDSALTALSQRRDVTPFMEGNELYRAAKAEYGSAKAEGFAPEVQEALDAEVTTMQRALETDFAQYVRSTTGQANREELHRVWLQTRKAADVTKIRERNAEIRKGQDTALVDIQDRFQRFDGAGAQIDAALKAGTITAQQASELRVQSAQAVAGRDQFYSLPEYQQAHNAIDAQFDAKLQGQPPTVQDNALRQAAHQTLRDRYDLALDGFLQDRAVPPTQFRARARESIGQVREALGTQLFPEARAKTVQKKVAAGEGADEITAALAELDEDRDASYALAGLVADPAARESMTAAIFGDPHPLIPTELYDVSAAWMSGRDPFLGRRMGRGDVEFVAYNAARRVADSAKANPADAKAATASLLAASGVNALDILQGMVTFELPESDKAATLAKIENIEAGLRAGIWARPDDIRQEIQVLRQRLDPVVLSLDGVPIRPFTTPMFRSREALTALEADPAWGDLLTRLGLDPDDQKQVDDFVSAQLDAIDRTNP